MPGYWKHAMRVKVGGVWLNDGIGIDHVVREYGPPIGGCTTFKPDITRVNPAQLTPDVEKPKDRAKKTDDSKQPHKPEHYSNKTKGETHYSAKQKTVVMSVGVVILVAIVMYVVLLVMS